MNVSAVLIPTFAASSVETVEMVTIVVGVGVSRRWRPTVIGAISGFIVLGALIAGLRQALSLIPIDGGPPRAAQDVRDPARSTR